MITRERLAELLRSVKVKDVALAAGMSTKTIYRLRNQETSPSLETALVLAAAVRTLKARKP